MPIMASRARWRLFAAHASFSELGSVVRVDRSRDDGRVTTAPEWKARRQSPEYAATRRRLIEAAERIVRDKGVAALRLDSVGEQVGLHRSSVYRYFDSKEELLTAVVVQATLRVGREVIAELGVSARPEQFLVEGLALAMARIATEPVHRSLMAPTTSEAMTRVGMRALTEGIRPLVEPMFVSAAQQGLLREGVSTDDALRWLLVVATGLFRSPDMVPDGDDLIRLLDLLLVPALFDPSKVQPLTEQRTGSTASPRMNMRVLHTGSPASSRASSRCSSAPSSDLGLQPRQVRAEARVDAAAELQVLAGVGAVDDHLVGGRAPPARVAVRPTRGWRRAPRPPATRRRRRRSARS